MRRSIPIWLLLGLLPSCTPTYQYAKNIKMISFEDNVTAGKGVGPIKGQSCQLWIMGRPFTDAPTLDAAVANARETNKVRYINNVSTDNDGFNAGVFAKYCLVVKGTGYE